MHRTFRLTTRVLLPAMFALALPATAVAQHGGGTTASTFVPPKEGTQFDFLVGQWELVGQPQATTLAQRIHGVSKFPGTWKAWRALDGWGIQDELRLTDPSGNPVLFTHTVRYFDVAARRWSLSAIDVYKSNVSAFTAQWTSGQMTVMGSGKDAEGKVFISRALFSKITPSSFSYRLDRSYDKGIKWTEGVMRIEAKRVAAVAPR